MMTYIFRGQLCGFICAECPESLSNVKVRLYRHRKDQDVTALAVASPRDTMVILTDEMMAEKASSLIAEVETDENGGFCFELGEEQKYNPKEAFEVDVYLETVPGRKGKPKPKPLQFTVTTVQPQWRMQKTEASYVAVWNYCLPYRFWCAVRARFDAWVICGRVVICQTEVPLAGVKVSAFDTDWIEDDELGHAVTDGAGKFRIDYTTADFQKTPFSPLINIELAGGPDLFFKVETSGGVLLLDEPRSRGRDPDRENAGPCFCVELCVDVEEEPPFNNPWFTHVGDFHIITDIDATTGLTNKALPPHPPPSITPHGGPNYGFFSNLKLRGFCPKTLPGDPSTPMRYRFLYEHPNNPGIEVPITGDALVWPVVVGSRLIWWDLYGSGPTWTPQSIWVAGSGATPGPIPIPLVPPGTPWGAPPAHVIVPDANGWINVDQDAIDGGFGQGPLICFRSASAVPGGAAPGSGAGNPVVDPKNGVALKLIFEAEPVGGGPPTFRNELPKILINNWIEVRQLDLQQFQVAGNSCTPLSSDLNILYTADHELMRDWHVSIETAASVPGGIPTLPSGTGPRGGFGNDHHNITAWPSCSYRVGLTTRRALTNGEWDDDADSSLVTFCK
jgi:hypothetical protein